MSQRRSREDVGGVNPPLLRDAGKGLTGKEEASVPDRRADALKMY